ncbi:hypothetical protein [Noviherbaspirillum malthae]|uniref:hypothetical protein n=1 Tax=Noviherbaspirillum malthae TaxID=1260987 RepID=UPI00188FF006|nr:hypothetical protein [Noviherbaspirillum malthae]
MDFANNAFYDKGISKAREGMSMIRPYEIQKDVVIYRYYDSTRAGSPQGGTHGPWWIEFEYFQQIKHFAARNGHAHSYAARLFAAILYEWSEVDAFVACRVRVPLKAWKGRGKQVEQDSDPAKRDARDLPRMTPMQGVLEIYQLCIPGLGGSQSISASALEIVSDGAL